MQRHELAQGVDGEYSTTSSDDEDDLIDIDDDNPASSAAACASETTDDSSTPVENRFAQFAASRPGAGDFLDQDNTDTVGQTRDLQEGKKDDDDDDDDDDIGEFALARGSRRRRGLRKERSLLRHKRKAAASAANPTFAAADPATFSSLQPQQTPPTPLATSSPSSPSSSSSIAAATATSALQTDLSNATLPPCSVYEGRPASVLTVNVYGNGGGGPYARCSASGRVRTSAWYTVKLDNAILAAASSSDMAFLKAKELVDAQWRQLAENKELESALYSWSGRALATVSDLTNNMDIVVTAKAEPFQFAGTREEALKVFRVCSSCGQTFTLLKNEAAVCPQHTGQFDTHLNQWVCCSLPAPSAGCSLSVHAPESPVTGTGRYIGDPVSRRALRLEQTELIRKQEWDHKMRTQADSTQFHAVLHERQRVDFAVAAPAGGSSKGSSKGSSASRAPPLLRAQPSQNSTIPASSSSHFGAVTTASTSGNLSSSSSSSSNSSRSRSNSHSSQHIGGTDKVDKTLAPSHSAARILDGSLDQSSLDKLDAAAAAAAAAVAAFGGSK